MAPVDKFCPSCGAPVNPKATAPEGLPSLSLGAVFNATEYAIDHKILALFSTYEIKDNSGKLLAYLKVVPMSYELSLENTAGEKIGHLQKDLMLAYDKPVWEAFDSQGHVVASIKLVKEKPPGSLLPHVISHIFDQKREEIGRFTRVGRGLTEQWALTSPDGSTVAELNRKVLPRTVITIKILNPVREPHVILMGLLQTLDTVEPPSRPTHTHTPVHH